MLLLQSLQSDGLSLVLRPARGLALLEVLVVLVVEVVLVVLRAVVLGAIVVPVGVSPRPAPLEPPPASSATATATALGVLAGKGESIVKISNFVSGRK